MSSQFISSRYNVRVRSIPALLAFLVYGCSDDGSTSPAPVVTDAGSDAAVTSDESSSNTSAATSSVVDETTTHPEPETSSSVSISESTVDTGAEAGTSSDVDSGTTSESNTGVTLDTPDADAGPSPIDWTEAPLGVTCLDEDNCVRGAHSLHTGAVATCAIKADGSLWCWGASSDMVEPEISPTPRTHGGLTDVAFVSVGSSNACAVREAGDVWCWGMSDVPMFGPDAEVVDYYGYAYYQASLPVHIPELTDVKAAGAGYSHVCAIKDDGSVWCWGSNALGQLGVEGLESSLTPVQVAGLPPARKIVIDGQSTCVVTVDGDVYCWGASSSGQLADGSELPEYAYGHPEMFSAVPLKVNGLGSVVDLASNGSAICSLDGEGEVVCWGDLGSVGLGEAPTSTPIAIPAWQGVKKIAIGYWHACAVVADGRVSCVGDGSSGQLGAVSLVPTTPVFASGIDDAVTIAAGMLHTCAVHASGEISCWGDDSYGQLGDGTPGLTGSDDPLPVLSEDAFASVVAGDSACGVKQNGEVACWGLNRNGELGVDPVLATVLPTPRDFPNLDDVTAVSGGYGHFCALHEDASVSCWGDNTYGQLGDATITDAFSATPSAVEELSGVVAIEASYGFSCALLDGGTVSCWGTNASGQLGRDANEVGFDAVPTPVPNVADAVELSLGMFHACARKNDGNVMCWGGNYFRQFGPGTEDPSPPVEVAALAGADAVAAGLGYVCRLNSDGTVACSGTTFLTEDEGDAGVGDGGVVVDNSLTTPIEGLSNVASVSPNCALRNDGSIACWSDRYPQQAIPLADGGTTLIAEFTELGAASQLSMSRTSGNSCAVLAADSSLVCWGHNDFGQLGTGEMGWRSEPELVVWSD